MPEFSKLRRQYPSQKIETEALPTRLRIRDGIAR
jgi:hypothetical protein